MPSATLVIADYPVGYASGFGETLFNLFSGFPNDKLWTAHPGHSSPAEDKRRGQSISLPSPARPRWLANPIALAYYPLLKAQQFFAVKESVRLLEPARQVLRRNRSWYPFWRDHQTVLARLSQ